MSRYTCTRFTDNGANICSILEKTHGQKRKEVRKLGKKNNSNNQKVYSAKSIGQLQYFMWMLRLNFFNRSHHLFVLEF